MNGEELNVNKTNIREAKGIKHKPKTTSGKRFKSALEKVITKKRAKREKKKKDQPPAIVSTSSQVLSSNIEIMQV